MSKSNLKIAYTSLEEAARRHAGVPGRTKPCALCVHPRRAEIEACIKKSIAIVAIVRALREQGDTRLTDGRIRYHRNQGHMQ